ncbi:MAG TPA: hypothetical protein VEH04_06900 [Verrucomicrobiae bacterium]|nr:hypothetical protein [Verrucomicrobiae bacterium]
MNVPASSSSELWVITTYFNFVRYERRLANYRHFRKHIGAPLLTVELAKEGEFVLKEGDADILIQCSDGDVMWQKERLLNHGLSRLPESCRYVAWVDCDLLFHDPGWIERAVKELQRVPLLQPFNRVVHASREARVSRFEVNPEWVAQPAMGAALAERGSFEGFMRAVMRRAAGTPASGMAWVARREVLERHGWYDASIIGGGDTALVCAAFNRPEIVVELHHLNARQREYYQDWALRFHNDVQERVSCISGTVLHLWHGELSDRMPQERHRGLREHQFDPQRDIALGKDGAWRWATDKPAMHRYLRRYFASRLEDGSPEGRVVNMP